MRKKWRNPTDYAQFQSLMAGVSWGGNPQLMLGCPPGWTGNRWISWTMDIKTGDRTNTSGCITNNNKIDKRRKKKGHPKDWKCFVNFLHQIQGLLLVKQDESSMCGCRIVSISSVTPLSSTKWLPWNRQFNLGKKNYWDLLSLDGKKPWKIRKNRVNIRPCAILGFPRVDLRDNHPVNVEDPPCFSVDFSKDDLPPKKKLHKWCRDFIHWKGIFYDFIPIKPPFSYRNSSI